MFRNCFYLTRANITNLQILPEKEISISELFSQCADLVEIIGLPSFISNHTITNISATFNACEALRKIDLGENFDWSCIQDADNLFTDCSSLEEITLGNLGTAYNTSTVGMFNGVDIENLKINHIGRFDTFGDERVTSSSEQLELLSIDRITPVCNIYKHNAVIEEYENLADIYYTIKSKQKLELQPYQVIENMLIDGDIAYEFVRFNTQEELNKLLYKQQILEGHYAIFKGLIVLFDTQLNNITILIEKG